MTEGERRLHEIIKPLYEAIMAQAKEFGVTLISERVYVIDLKSGAATDMRIVPSRGHSE